MKFIGSKGIRGLGKRSFEERMQAFLARLRYAFLDTGLIEGCIIMGQNSIVEEKTVPRGL